jgi:hypothetical protein
MNGKRMMRGLVACVALLVALAAATDARAQVFYREVEKDGRIYVFAIGKRFDTFDKSGGSEIGQAITRLGYGPNGETVVFDSEDAINLYNFKHNLPGEYFPKPEPKPPSPFPNTKFSGLLFGDYYYYDKWHQDTISATNTNHVQNQQGFWLRRAYFTADFNINEKFTTRFRLESNSNGQFTSPGNITPFVKDAYLRWTYHGKQQMTLGISPTLTFDWIEGWWGLRHIEKTPADLYRIDSSRDFGFTLSGPIEAVKGLSYGGQIANDSGNGSETDKYKTGRFEGRFDRNPGIGINAIYNYGKRPNGQDRSTFGAFGGYRNKNFRAAAQYLWQKRKSGNATPDQTIDIWSAFGIWDFVPKKAEVYFRFDDVKGKRGGADTGLPGADGIDYWILSPAQPFKLYIFGAEWYLLHPSIRIGPNLQLAKYENDPNPVAFPGRDEDRIYRITFFWTF